MDGFELARALREEECCRGAVLIAVTGYSDHETTRRGAECGIDIHLAKPADAHQLLGLLRQIEAAAEGNAR
jgi:CheY-like chemotaxis protein